MEKVSIIVPVYNVEPYLARCIDSLLGQSYSDLEILLIDDCSADKSASIMTAYAKKDSRVRCFYQLKNQGVSSARNLGLEKMDGDWVCFCSRHSFYRDPCGIGSSPACCFDVGRLCFGGSCRVGKRNDKKTVFRNKSAAAGYIFITAYQLWFRNVDRSHRNAVLGKKNKASSMIMKGRYNGKNKNCTG